MSTKADKIKHYILTHIKDHPLDIVAVATQKFHVTRTTIHRHLNTLLGQGLLLKSGTTRAVKYVAKDALTREMTYSIKPQLSEYDILQHDFRDVFKQFPEHINDICVYGFTEILNNAIEHSQGTTIRITTNFANDRLSLIIQDDGIGVFKNIFDYFKLEDMRDSLFQLTKGKITTDPTHHTGEGIFFTSRAFDYFEIYANNLHYFRDNQANDWAFATSEKTQKGSMICLSIANNTTTTLVATFKKYQDPDSLAFNRTEIRVELSRFGNEPFISRSQAKRVTFGLEKFQQITLDFSGVRLVGQGFVDEVFCVFAQANPTLTIHYIHANEDVTFMIKRGLATRAAN